MGTGQQCAAKQYRPGHTSPSSTPGQLCRAASQGSPNCRPQHLSWPEPLTQVCALAQPGQLHGQECNCSQRQGAGSILHEAVGLHGMVVQGSRNAQRKQASSGLTFMPAGRHMRCTACAKHIAGGCADGCRSAGRRRSCSHPHEGEDGQRRQQQEREQDVSLQTRGTQEGGG